MTIEDLRASQAIGETQSGTAGADPNFPGDHNGFAPQGSSVTGGPSSRNGHRHRDTHTWDAIAGPTSGLTRQLSSPVEGASVRDHTPQSTNVGAAHKARASSGAPDYPVTDNQATTTRSSSPGNQDCGDQSGTGNQARSVAASNPPGPAKGQASPKASAPVLADPLLALAADVLDDLQRVRIANENRLRQLTRDETDKDGEERGFGLTVDHPDVARLSALVDALIRAEHDATLNLQRMVRKHPLGPWIKAARGVGEKQGARLLAAIGDPYWNDLHNRPRTVSELWKYCGYHVLRPPGGQLPRDTQGSTAAGVPTSAHHPTSDIHIIGAGGTQSLIDQSTSDNQVCLVDGDLTGSDPGQMRHAAHSILVGVAATPKRGQRANWSAAAKMRAYLIAGSIVKAGGPYREVYDQGRVKYADAVHRVECKRCGPSGTPAPVGSPLSAGHQHARALRLVSKAVLRDLWREAKRIHDETEVT